MLGLLLLFGLLSGAFCISFGTVQVLCRNQPPLRVDFSIRARRIALRYGDTDTHYAARQQREGIGAITAGVFLLTTFGLLMAAIAGQSGAK